MKAEFWHQRWKNKEIQFHEQTANPLLVRHIDSLGLTPGSRIFVPLCGKTLDIGWLLARGHRVVGAELSEDAVEQLFAKLGMKPQRRSVDGLIHFHTDGLDIFVGDIFQLRPETLGDVHAVFDRAALVALPEEMRLRYAQHVTAITGGVSQLLISYEYDQSLQAGPPFAVSENEITAHYARTHEVMLLQREEMTGGLKGKCAASQTVWLLQRRPDGIKPDSSQNNRRLLAGLSLAMLLSSLGTSIANVALPELTRALGASLQQVQWVVLAYLLAVTVFIVGVGRLGDLIGQHRMLLAGIILFTIASAVGGTVPSLEWLIVARAVQGVGAAIMMSLSLAMISEAMPSGKTGRAMGMLGAMSAVGTALGPALGGVLISAFGWRSIFFVHAPLGVLAFVLLRGGISTSVAPSQRSRAAFDYRGMGLLAVTLTSYALAMTVGRGHVSGLNALLFIVAVVGGLLFGLVQERSSSPLIPMTLLRDRGRRAGFAMSFLVATVLMTSLVVGPFYLSYGLQLTAAQVGLLMAAGPVVVALTGVPVGHLVDRFGAANMTLAGLATIGVGSGALTLLPTTSGMPGYVLPIMLMTAGYAVFQTANNTVMMTTIEGNERGLVSGLLNLSRNLGLITG
ncbi:MAG: thiopurine S-methyltransferase, partial [Verrucomicrobiaceae bacterium]|nr:thiopurine S-methyltransferase [Verrucomicrobiaceae bacterium]